MFTGIVKELGEVVEVETSAHGARLSIRAPHIASRVQVGDSVAVNGVCLTVVHQQGSVLYFDAVLETLRRSNLGALGRGEHVNLEDALRAGEALGGHFVQGHVDTTGTVRQLLPQGNAVVMTVQVGEEWMRYVVPKGSVAVDGVSLTVVDAGREEFSVWLIPHTRAVTTLGRRQVGDRVNVEFDVLAKYVEKLLQARPGRGGVDMELLRRTGFLD
ncbi:MAG: riboflavin synthase [Armatimonadota bacterium]|nr:riboflavin synthase [bacterium]MCS7308683.1 riboflavin synthase [Armatimonadota bacterium]MDW8104405.1 riboflavin synthase [Armatimonadota bacterium]MDW8289178.1 riboflavin synthase [Armatimonadota bacterium]